MPRNEVVLIVCEYNILARLQSVLESSLTSERNGIFRHAFMVCAEASASQHLLLFS
jgi:hypothetical protein